MIHESKVNYYATAFPGQFKYAEGAIVKDNSGKEYIDFFSGAGTLNYGHNHPEIKRALISFLENQKILHCMDMNTEMKTTFLENFGSIILGPRSLDYVVQFPGPTGTNAVEAAVKLARICTKRNKIVAFTNSFHGMTSMSLALSGSRKGAQKYNQSQEVIYFPFDGFLKEGFNSIEYLKKMILSKGSGVELPAAVILETIQGEGGVNIASISWLQELWDFTRNNDILMIVDDIQVGCGRSGQFFSFERAGIIPDIVLLSKSLSGYGLPLSMMLLKPEYDMWKPGEHNGTFRANNLSLCSGNEALNLWKDNSLEIEIELKSKIIKSRLEDLKKTSPNISNIRGVGLIWGVEMNFGKRAKAVSKALFDSGMLVETCGPEDEVLKLLPPLTISNEDLIKGLDKLENVLLNQFEMA